MSKTSKSLYINIWDYVNDKYPFQIFIGGRGCGKTYSALRGAIENESKFILMRRTAQEVELMLDSRGSEGANPFKPLNDDYNWNIGLNSIVKNMAGIYRRELTENGKVLPAGEPLGYAVSLSTINSIRGISFAGCTDIIYDEFIPEKHVKKIRGEADALFNAYETANRNREFTGEAPMRLWLLANSNDIYNQIFVGLGIVNKVERMLKRGQEHLYLEERGLAIHYIRDNVEFVEKKSKTALYRLTEGSSFHDMALSNEFAYNDFSLIGYRPLKGYRPVCALDDAYIYKKKGSHEYYVSYSPAKVPKFDAKTEQDALRFKQYYAGRLLPDFIQGNITFESYDLKEKLLSFII